MNSAVCCHVLLCRSESIRTGFILSQGGEFAFVLLSLACQVRKGGWVGGWVVRWIGGAGEWVDGMCVGGQGPNLHHHFYPLEILWHAAPCCWVFQVQFQPSLIIWPDPVWSLMGHISLCAPTTTWTRPCLATVETALGCPGGQPAFW